MEKKTSFPDFGVKHMLFSPNEIDQTKEEI